MARSVVFRNGDRSEEDVDPNRMPELHGPGTVAWMACDPGSSDELDAAAALTGIPRERIDAVLTPHRRDRMWRFDERYAIHTHIIRPDRNEAEATRLVLLVSSEALVTCCDDPDLDIGDVLTGTLDTDALARAGTAEILRAILQWLVTGYQKTALEIDEGIDEIEESLFEESPTAIDRVQRDTYGLQRRLVLLRRSVLPLREDFAELRHLTSRSGPSIGEHLPVRQLDHLLTLIDSLREMLVSTLSTNINLQQNRLNKTMKKLTGWAAVIAIPTFITSWYGMNVPMPAQTELRGALLASAVVLAGAAVMYLIFRRKDWL
ncbi:magnesium transporter [Lipingzhangella halophila]|uniref:Magnesium transporter n=1 Tax=Lipingzhangella halophila TaxID=1783352 RepID=A0A7W7RHV2_9ACTN|nr:CorA family divalent cation transporter [Lipingzhangella halophila]MBB4932274.1 magnesium transporter [Lipingzhangella halophila]